MDIWYCRFTLEIAQYTVRWLGIYRQGRRDLCQRKTCTLRSAGICSEKLIRRLKMFRSVIFISVVFVFSLSAYSQVKSIYTNLAEKKCRTIELTSEGTGWYRGLCPGL